MPDDLKARLKSWAETYNDAKYFREDPIIFPEHFAEKMRSGNACLGDVEVAAVFAAHFAWGRRAMIVRDGKRLMDEMDWKPYDYVMRGQWKDADESIHRTVKWCDVAQICSRLKAFYLENDSLESLGAKDIRTVVFGQKPDPKAPDKKINMMRRWMVRDDGKVDLGVWKNTDPAGLLIPLDVHVHNMASELGITSRSQKDLTTVLEITDFFKEIFPLDPCKGDFSLFGYGVNHPKRAAESRNST